jgi:hypothetical protein
VQRGTDKAGARESELLVGTWLGGYKIANLDANDRMDYWVPGLYLDVKEKRQPLTPRWPLPPGTVEADAFVLDELSVRRAMQHAPHSYFILHDCPNNRWFLARSDEIVCADRERINREGATGVKKGKWVINLTQFRHLTDPAEQLLPTVLADQIGLPWKKSECLVQTAEERT